MTERDAPRPDDDDWGSDEPTPWDQPPPPGEPAAGSERPIQETPAQQPPGPMYGPPQGQPAAQPYPQPFMQPQQGGAQPTERIQNYLVPAIASTVLCCLPTGIAAIIYASQVNGKLASGDVAGAKKAADNAKLWTIISVVAGLVVGFLYFVSVAAGA